MFDWPSLFPKLLDDMAAADPRRRCGAAECAFEQAYLGSSSYGPIVTLFPGSLQQILQIWRVLEPGKTGVVVAGPFTSCERPQTKKYKMDRSPSPQPFSTLTSLATFEYLHSSWASPLFSFLNSVSVACGKQQKSHSFDHKISNDTHSFELFAI
jgi:hypothetical protein